jgi:glycopeptide antibiotics resistance protein
MTIDTLDIILSVGGSLLGLGIVYLFMKWSGGRR